jgi:hypothetical protein
MATKTDTRLVFTHYIKKGTIEAEVSIGETNTGALKLELQVEGETFDKLVITPAFVEALRAYLTN